MCDGEWEPVFSLLEKGVTNVERRKNIRYSVDLD